MSENKESEEYRFSTRAVHGNGEKNHKHNPSATPIYQNASYEFEDTEQASDLFSLQEEGYVCSRISNPTAADFERKLSTMEGGVGAKATSSGMAALSLIVFSLLKKGDNLVSSSDLYGGTYTFFSQTLPDLGMECRMVEANDLEKMEDKIDENTKFIHLETLGNPSLEVPDFRKVADIAEGAGVPLVVDNTFATPYLCRPFEYGADIVWHSTTKWINGHGRTIGGAVVDSGNFDWEKGDFPSLTEPDPTYHGLSFSEEFGKEAFIRQLTHREARDFGASQSPFDSFLDLMGMETLPLRMDKHCENAMQVARFLKDHEKISWVNYPGLEEHSSHDLASDYLDNGYGGVMTFGVKGGYEAGKKLIESVSLITFLANVGDTKSLIIHPSSTTHRQLTEEEKEKAKVTDDLIRFSVGIEDPEDIIEDLKKALAKI